MLKRMDKKILTILSSKVLSKYMVLFDLQKISHVLVTLTFHISTIFIIYRKERILSRGWYLSDLPNLKTPSALGANFKVR